MMETQTRDLTSTAYKGYFETGYTYTEYQVNFEKELNSGEGGPHAHYLPINWQRVKRIDKTLKLSTEMMELLSTLDFPLKWLVISEHWCGDAAQILPVLARIADLSKGKIEMKIVYRDQNQELMNAHLTGGSMSIPKVIQLNSNFEFLGEWGPRPSEGQELVLKLKSDPDTAASYSEHLHKWYARNKQADIQNELIRLLRSA
ncbi:MAG: thioredoxin family protein [Cyclobacteriaceae bacterium]